MAQGRTETTSMCHSISRVMEFCLNGVTHNGKSRRNKRNSASYCAFVSKAICLFPFVDSMAYLDNTPALVTHRTGILNREVLAAHIAGMIPTSVLFAIEMPMALDPMHIPRLPESQSEPQRAQTA